MIGCRLLPTPSPVISPRRARAPGGHGAAAGALVLAVIAAPVGAPRAGAQDRVIFQTRSPYNNQIIVTEDDRGLRSLRFGLDGVRQSVVKPGDPDHLELAYAPGMLLAFGLCERPNRILIVGLGGATLPRFVHRHWPDATIDVAELDPEVVAVARAHFEFREDALLRAHVGDGRTFIEACRVPYDIVMLDAFSATEIPYRLATIEFLRAVRRALAPGGVVAGNLWGRFSNPLYDSMVRTYQEAFDEVCITPIRDAGNEIVLALPRKGVPTREELAGRLRTLSRARAFRFDLGDVVEHGYRHIAERDPGARVLRDADPR